MKVPSVPLTPHWLTKLDSASCRHSIYMSVHIFPREVRFGLVAGSWPQETPLTTLTVVVNDMDREMERLLLHKVEVTMVPNMAQKHGWELVRARLWGLRDDRTTLRLPAHGSSSSRRGAQQGKTYICA